MNTPRPEFAALAGSEPSVLILGGGINGAGLFRELALQEVDVTLVDKSDFGSGTSAASTRIIHGGLRYLENAEFRLVRESVRERNRLLRNAPHYVKPLATTIPVFHWFSGIGPAIRNFLGHETPPGNRGALLVKAGLTMYDCLSGWRSPLPRHRFRSRRAALRLRPALNPAVVSTATYYDARITYPERLCLELVQDAEALTPQARAVNYVRMEGAAGRTVRLRDQLSGAVCEVRPRVVVNATGAWIDLTNRSMNRDSDFIGGTKGSHIVLDHPQLVEQTRGEMIYFANRDGRICIFYPFFGRIIAGSTDIPTADPEAVCDEAEVDYILDSLRLVFPSIRVDRSHVVFRFCGVRPLPRSRVAIPGQISRDYSYPQMPAGGGIDFSVYSLVGGKLTAFRALAEHVADAILPLLGRSRIRRSDHTPIGGGTGYPAAGLELQRLPEDRVHDLLERYGTRASDLAAYVRSGPDAPLAHAPVYSRREIEFLAAREKTVHLDDILLRRSILGLLGHVSRNLLVELAGIAAGPLHWSRQDVEVEVERTAHLLERVHGITAHQLNPSPVPR